MYRIGAAAVPFNIRTEHTVTVAALQDKSIDCNKKQRQKKHKYNAEAKMSRFLRLCPVIALAGNVLIAHFLLQREDLHLIFV